MAWVLKTDLIYEDSVDPSVSDDFASGFQVGDDARNTVTGETFTCVGDGLWSSITKGLALKTFYETTGTALNKLLTPTYVTGVLDILDPNSLNPGNYFSLAATGIITYTGPDLTYVIGYSASGVNNINGSRSTGVHSIFISGVQSVKSERFTYHRSNGDGWDSGSYEGVYLLTSGDTIDLRSKENAAADAINLIESRTNLIIKSAS